MQQDTLLYVEQVRARVQLGAFFFYNHLRVEELVFQGGLIDVDKWRVHEVPPSSVRDGRSIFVNQLDIGDMHVRMDTLFGLRVPLRVALNVQLMAISYVEQIFSAQLTHFSARERHKGAVLKQGTALLHWNTRERAGHIAAMQLRTAHSYLVLSELGIKLPPAADAGRKQPNFTIRLDSTSLSLSEWAPYWPAIPFVDKRVHIALHAKGNTQYMVGRIDVLRAADAFHLEGPFSYRGLGKGRWKCDVAVEKGVFSPQAIAPFLSDTLGAWVAKLPQQRYEGLLHSTHDTPIALYGTLSSVLGDMRLELGLQDLRTLRYTGSITSAKLQLPQGFFPVPLREFGIKATFTGEGVGVHANSTWHVTAKDIVYDKYHMAQVTLQVAYARLKEQVEATVKSKEVTFSTSIQWHRRAQEKRLQAVVRVTHVDLHAIGLANKPVHAAGNLHIDLRGRNWHTVLGQVHLKELYLRTPTDMLYEPQVHLTVTQLADRYHTVLTSDMLSARLVSAVMPWQLVSKQVKGLFTGAFDTQKLSVMFDPVHEARVHVKPGILLHYASLWNDRLPRFSEESLLTITLVEDKDVQVVTLDMRADTIHTVQGSSYKNMFNFSYDISPAAHARSYFQYKADRLNIKGMPTLTSPFISIQLANKEAQVEVGFAPDSSATYAHLRGRGAYQAGDWRITLDTSRLQILGQPWHFSDMSTLTWSLRHGFRNVDVHLFSQAQSIALQGHWTKGASALHLQLAQFDMRQFDPLLHSSVGGALQADMRFERKENNLQLNIALSMDKLSVNEIHMGAMKLKLWSKKGKLLVQGSLHDGGAGMLIVDGSLDIAKREHNISFRATKAPLHFLAPFVYPVFVDVAGYVTGEVDIDINQASYNTMGTFHVHGGYLKLDYLKTNIHVSGPIQFMGHAISFDRLRGYDSVGGRVTFQGGLAYDMPTPLEIDLLINLSKYQLIYMNRGDNENFYGQVYMSGNMLVKGEVSFPTLSGTLQTEAATRLYLPMLTEDSPQQHPFIQFMHKQDDAKIIPAVAEIKSLPIDFNIEVRPGATCEIITQINPPGYLRFSGEGQVRLQINAANDITILGGLDITKGNYRVNFYGLFNKDFDIEAGSRMHFHGLPGETRVNLGLRYSQRVLAGPMQDYIGTNARLQADNRVQVDVLVGVRGLLLFPTLSFDLEMPELQTGAPFLHQIRSDEQALKRQVISLIFLQRFAPKDGLIDRNQDSNVDMLTNLGGEFFAAPINTLLSDLDDDLLLDIDIARQRLNLSYTFLQGKLHIQSETPFSSNSSRAENRKISTYLGNWGVEYLLSDDGRWRIKGYVNTLDRQRQYFLPTNAPFVTGVSLLHRRRFNRSFSTKYKREQAGKL